jgi:predicted nucleic acid-binding Zn ribbon protein
MLRGHALDSFGTILSGLAKRLGLESSLLELRLQQRWRDIMGEPIGSHTWPDRIRFKKLYLVVRNSVWLQQLTFLKPALLEKLQSHAGRDAVSEIVLRVGEIPSHDPSTVPPQASAVAPSEEDVHAALSCTAGLKDELLRRRFTEAILTYPSPPRRP